MPEYPKITSKCIKYNSPSGYVVIGKYIPPFEKNSSGYGFKGVLIEDKLSGKLQCSICGKWYEQLISHIKPEHNIDTDEYRKVFGLLQSTALKSKKMRLRASEVMIKLRKDRPQCRYKFKRSNEYAGNRRNKPKALESQNKYGVCRLQLMERIMELNKELGKTPTLIDLRNRYGGVIMTLLSERFGSYVQLCRDMGLDANISNYNPKYSKEYFIEKALSNEATTRIFTSNELRALYKFFPKGIKQLKSEVNNIQSPLREGLL